MMMLHSQLCPSDISYFPVLQSWWYYPENVPCFVQAELNNINKKLTEHFKSISFIAKKNKNSYANLNLISITVSLWDQKCQVKIKDSNFGVKNWENLAIFQFLKFFIFGKKGAFSNFDKKIEPVLVSPLHEEFRTGLIFFKKSKKIPTRPPFLRN